MLAAVLICAAVLAGLACVLGRASANREAGWQRAWRAEMDRQARQIGNTRTGKTDSESN